MCPDNREKRENGAKITWVGGIGQKRSDHLINDDEKSHWIS